MNLVARFAFRTLALVAASTVVACGGSASPSGTSSTDGTGSGSSTNGTTSVDQATSGSASNASGADFCSTYCGRISSCDSTQDLDICNAKCENLLGPALARSNPSITASETSCVEKADCAHILGNDLMTDCEDTAIEDEVPSSAAQSFCTAWQTVATQCDADLDFGKCLGVAKQFSDAVLSESTACTKKSCGAVDECIDATWGNNDEDVDGGAEEARRGTSRAHASSFVARK